jgi:hypothetical protein
LGNQGTEEETPPLFSVSFRSPANKIDLFTLPRQARRKRTVWE